MTREIIFVLAVDDEVGCYRCGSPDHMANACNVAKDVKCKKCNTAVSL